MIEAVFFSIFVIKQQQQQELFVQIIDALNNFINNPLFAEYGPIGLFINGVFSTFIPFPPEVTAISLILAGISRIDILAILVTSWIIGAAVGYFAGLSGNKLVAIFTGRRKEKGRRVKEEDNNNDNDNNNTLSRYNQKFQNNSSTNTSGDNKNKSENKRSRYRQLLERYGWAIIFVSPWIPILGDIIPLIAGAKRYEIKKFMIAIAAGKIARAVAVVFLGSYLASISTPPWV